MLIFEEENLLPIRQVVFLDQKIFRKNSFTVIGMKITCSFDENKHTRAVPKLWDAFYERYLELNDIIGYTGYGVSFDSYRGEFF